MGERSVPEACSMRAFSCCSIDTYSTIHGCIKMMILWLQSHLWLVTEDPATGCHGELCVSGSRVVWYEGLHPHNRTVRKVYSVESEILQAFWCQFREESVSPSGGESRREDQSLRCVCVREHSCLTFFMQTGAVHYIPLPFLVSGWVAL